MVVEVTDLGSPPRTSSANIIQNVIRNKNAPRFEPNEFTNTIDRTHSPDDVIRTLTAQDGDSRAPFDVITYALLEGDDAQLFRVRENNGQLRLASSVAQLDGLQYTVRTINKKTS